MTSVLSTSRTRTQQDPSPKTQEKAKKVTLSAEAERISRILENCIRQIELAAILSSVPHTEASACVLDEKLTRALQKHQELTEKFERVTLEGAGSEGGNKEATKKARAGLQKVTKASVRDALRLLRAQPQAISGLEAGASERELIKVLKLFYSQMVDKLLTSVDKDIQLDLYKAPPPAIHQLVHMAPVEEELTAAIKEINAKISQKDIEIQSLRQTLAVGEAQKVCLPHVEEIPEPPISKKVISMQLEVDQMKNQLYNLVCENKHAERVLQEKKEKVEVEIEYLLETFDCDIEEKQADLELNEIDNVRLEEEMQVMEEPFYVVQGDYAEIQKRLQREEAERLEQERILALKTQSSIMIQAWWRGYVVRKATRAKTKGKGKGKGKAEKKGKGKKK